MKITSTELYILSLSAIYFKNILSSSDDEEVDKEVGDDDTEKTPEEKLKLLKRQSPELFPLLAELKVYKAELSNLLIPLTKIFTEQGKSYIQDSRKNRIERFAI